MLQIFNEKNRDLIVNISGRLVHRDEAGISPFDSVVQGGDAVWEGLRLYNGRIFKLREHLDRLRSSALALAFLWFLTFSAVSLAGAGFYLFGRFPRFEVRPDDEPVRRDSDQGREGQYKDAA